MWLTDQRIITAIGMVTYTARILSPLKSPAFSAAPPSNTADTCCKGGYKSPLIDLKTPPSQIWPRMLKPKPKRFYRAINTIQKYI